MINLFEELEYKTGKSITTLLNKAEKSTLVEQYKPYDSLKPSNVVEIIEYIIDILPKTKIKLAESILRKYDGMDDDGTVEKKVEISLDISDRPMVEYLHERQVYYLSEELFKIGYKAGAKTDFGATYMRFQRTLGKDELNSSMITFVEAKMRKKFKDYKDRKANEKFEYMEFRDDFCKALYTNEDLKEKYDKIHIEELIFLYRYFKNYTFAQSYAENRLFELEEERESIQKLISQK